MMTVYLVIRDQTLHFQLQSRAKIYATGRLVPDWLPEDVLRQSRELLDRFHIPSYRIVPLHVLTGGRGAPTQAA